MRPVLVTRLQLIPVRMIFERLCGAPAKALFPRSTEDRFSAPEASDAATALFQSKPSRGFPA
jgi:hypothetical protein